jgi:ribosomal protein S18 acetylase RimI-like enzyme
MELKQLAEVDLREAIGPINRAVTGHYLPAVRTVSLVRERAQLGVLDLKLSRCVFLNGRLAGTCLVERVDERAHLDAIGVEPMAQQQGVGYALLESACVAAEALGVKLLSAELSDSDAPALATLQHAGFVRGRELSRYELKGPPAQLAIPEEIGEGEGMAQRTPATLGQTFVRPVPLSEALEFLGRARGGALAEAPFSGQPAVLEHLKSKLTAYLLLQLDEQSPVVGAAVIERERHLLLALGGDAERLAPFLVLLMRRHGVTTLESLPEGDPLEVALGAAGMTRTAARRELLRRF